MKTNRKSSIPVARTHEGAPSVLLSNEAILRRTVMACLLWEDTFYVDGVAATEQIQALAVWIG